MLERVAAVMLTKAPTASRRGVPVPALSLLKLNTLRSELVLGTSMTIISALGLNAMLWGKFALFLQDRSSRDAIADAFDVWALIPLVVLLIGLLFAARASLRIQRWQMEHL